MSKGNTITFAGNDFPFDKKRWDTLPALPAALALDLFQASNIKQVEARRLAGWQAWWGSTNDPWGKLFTPKEIRKLDQLHRAMAETGLGVKLSRRKMHQPPLEDGGILCRVAGIEWEAGVRDTLSRLPVADNPTRTAALVSSALRHAVELKKPHSQQWLVEWAFDHAVSLEGLIDSATVAQMWSNWTKLGKLGHEHPVYAKAMGVIPIPAASEGERQVWNAWVRSEFRHHTHEAIAAWCCNRPGTWERMHQQALQDDQIKPAWLLACRRASQFGGKDPLWQEAIASPSAPGWMHGLWGKNRSPLVAWMSDALEHRQTTGLPGTDPVSKALVQMGAPLPGAPIDRALGGESLVDCVEVYYLEPGWTGQHPEWILPNVKTGRTPLFEQDSWYSANKYVELGLSWSHRDHAGRSAWGAFLSEFSPSGREAKIFYKQAIELFASGAVPVLDDVETPSIAGGVAAQNNAELFRAFMAARAKHPTPPLPCETLGVAKQGNAGMLAQWRQACVERNAWSRAHDVSMWRGLLLCQSPGGVPLPAVEDGVEPSWLWLLRQTPGSRHEILEPLALLPAWGLSAIDGAHSAWSDPKLGQAWLDLVCGAAKEQRACLAVAGADPQWWVAQIQAAGRYEEEGLLPRKFLVLLRDVGLPLDEPAVVDAVSNFPAEELTKLPEDFTSALQARAMDLGTATIVAPTRKLRL